MAELTTSMSLVSSTHETKRVIKVDVENGPMGRIRFLSDREAKIVRIVAVAVNDEPWNVTIYGRRVRKDGGFVKNSTNQPISTTTGPREQVEAVQGIIQKFREGFLPAGDETSLSKF